MKIDDVIEALRDLHRVSGPTMKSDGAVNRVRDEAQLLLTEWDNEHLTERKLSDPYLQDARFKLVLMTGTDVTANLQDGCERWITRSKPPHKIDAVYKRCK